MKQALEDRNPHDVRLWTAASSRIDTLIKVEKESDGDGGKKFATEQATLAALQRRLAVRCGDQSAVWVPLRQSEVDPDTWRRVTQPKILNNLCEWYALGDET